MSKSVNNKETEAKNKERVMAMQILIDHYKNCFQSDSGKYVYNDLKRRLGYAKTPYGSGMNELDMAYNCGQQSAINFIVEAVEFIKPEPKSTLIKPSGIITN